MSKENREFDIEARLIDFAVHIIRNAETVTKTQKIAPTVRNKLHDSKFLVRYSIFSLKT